MEGIIPRSKARWLAQCEKETFHMEKKIHFVSKQMFKLITHDGCILGWPACLTPDLVVRVRLWISGFVCLEGAPGEGGRRK